MHAGNHPLGMLSVPAALQSAPMRHGDRSQAMHWPAPSRALARSPAALTIARRAAASLLAGCPEPHVAQSLAYATVVSTGTKALRAGQEAPCGTARPASRPCVHRQSPAPLPLPSRIATYVGRYGNSVVQKALRPAREGNVATVQPSPRRVQSPSASAKGSVLLTHLRSYCVSYAP